MRQANRLAVGSSWVRSRSLKKRKKKKSIKHKSHNAKSMTYATALAISTELSDHLLVNRAGLLSFSQKTKYWVLSPTAVSALIPLQFF